MSQQVQLIGLPAKQLFYAVAVALRPGCRARCALAWCRVAMTVEVNDVKAVTVAGNNKELAHSNKSQPLTAAT